MLRKKCWTLSKEPQDSSGTMGNRRGRPCSGKALSQVDPLRDILFLVHAHGALRETDLALRQCAVIDVCRYSRSILRTGHQSPSPSCPSGPWEDPGSCSIPQQAATAKGRSKSGSGKFIGLKQALQFTTIRHPRGNLTSEGRRNQQKAHTNIFHFDFLRTEL